MDLDQLKKRAREYDVECKECLERHGSIVAHLKNKHNISVGQYVNKHPGAKVVSPIVSEIMNRMGRAPKATNDLDILASELIPESEKWKEALEFQRIHKFKRDLANLELVPEKDDHFVMIPDASLILYAMRKGKNVFLEGPTGSGKSELVKQMHAYLERPMRRVNMHGDVTTSNFIGGKEVGPQGTYFKYGFLPAAMKGGYVLFVDEVDFTPPHIAAVLHPVLEDKKQLFIPETQELIKAKEGFCVMAAANTGGKGDTVGAYTGTEILNTAFLNRFSVKVMVDYLDEKNEVSLLAAKCQNIPREDAIKLVRLAAEVRNAFKQGNLAVTMSTRTLLEYAALRETFTSKVSLDASLLDWLDATEKSLVLEFMKKVGVEYK